MKVQSEKIIEKMRKGRMKYALYCSYSHWKLRRYYL